MLRLDKIVSRLTSGNIKNIKNRVEYGIESVGNRIKEYVEAGIDRTKEYIETASKYITNTGNKIREKVETAKYVIPNALMNTLIFSNNYGRMGYYGAKAYFSYKMAKQAEKGKIYYEKSNIIIPTVVGVLSGLGGFAIATLLGDLNSLNHHYQELELDYQQLQNQVNHLENETSTYNNTLVQLELKYQNITQQINTIGTKINYLENETSTYNNTLVQLELKYQNITQQLNNIGIEIKELENDTNDLYQKYQQISQQLNATETEIKELENEVQSLINQVQNENTLEEILFGNNNNYAISVIQINSVTVENGIAYVQGTTYSGANVTLEIPISYVEKGNVNIQEFVNIVQQNGWNAYIAIDRADLQYMNLSNNQNGTYVISIQPNQPVNIALMASTANGSTIDNVLNHLTQYDIVIQDGDQDGHNVYGAPDALWGYASNSSVVVNFSDNPQYYSLADNMVSIADQIINSPNNYNPSSSGYIDTYSIFNGTIGVYTNPSGSYAEYNVGQTYIPLIVLQSGQGNTIINNISS